MISSALSQQRLSDSTVIVPIKSLKNALLVKADRDNLKKEIVILALKGIPGSYYSVSKKVKHLSAISHYFFDIVISMTFSGWPCYRLDLLVYFL